MKSNYVFTSNAEANRTETHWRERERVSRKKKFQKQMKLYYMQQRAIGVCLFMLAALSVWVSDGDATAGAVLAAMGFYICRTRKMILVNDFYWSVKKR